MPMEVRMARPAATRACLMKKWQRIMPTLMKTPRRMTATMTLKVARTNLRMRGTTLLSQTSLHRWAMHRRQQVRYVIISECPPLESNVDMNKLIGKTVLVGCGILTLRGAGSWAECILMLPTWGSETGLIAQLRRMW